jgi:formate-dependent nitrite reductase membrane component NrfD
MSAGIDTAPPVPDERPVVPADAHDSVRRPGKWQGPTYYGRSQLKPAPFNNWVVGGYIALAGLSGSAALIGAIAEATRGRAARRLVRRSRYLSLLAPTIGSALLVWDLHTPQRFYNMLRVAKRTSPMSIGTWILLAFTGPAMLAAACQMAADRRPRWRWPLPWGRAAQIPAAIAGAGLSTYTAALLAATSTPLWAAAPASLAVRFGSSSMATGAACLALGERAPRTRRALDALAVAALSAELAATMHAHRSYRRAGVEEALDGGWGRVEALGATGLGVVAPLGLKIAALALGRDSRVANLAILAGSLLLRVSVMAAGDASAARPEVSFRFSTPRNLPAERKWRRLL